jgi:hypothetical protein
MRIGEEHLRVPSATIDTYAVSWCIAITTDEGRTFDVLRNLCFQTQLGTAEGAFSIPTPRTLYLRRCLKHSASIT